MTSQQTSIDRALAALAQLARAQADLAAEEPAARAEFFAHLGGLPTPEDTSEALDELSEQRFLEWFLLERQSSAWDAIPVEVLAQGQHFQDAPKSDPESAATLRERYPALRNSRAGIFQVTEIEAQYGFWVRDLFGSGRYPIVDEISSTAMAEGDLIVGRLFPGPVDTQSSAEASFELSRSAGCFRDPNLAQAIEHDLEQLRQGRRGPLRMQQKELEMMFFGQPAEASDPAGVITDARVLLEKNGLAPQAIDLIFEELRATPFDSSLWAHGTDDVLVAILNHLAFDTEVDLESARRALLAAWPVLQQPAGPRQQSPAGAFARAPKTSEDVASALSSFEAGRAAGQDLEDLFRDLERDLGLEGDEEPDPGDLPDFPGVVAAMVEEFLWETEREGDAETAERFDVLRAFGRFAADIGVFENLDRNDLVRFVTFWIPESGELRQAAELDALFDALAAFVAWARVNHQLDRLDDVEASLEEARQVLPRVQRVNAAIDLASTTSEDAADDPSGPQPEGNPIGELLEVLETQAAEPALVELRTLSGVELRARVLPPAVVSELSAGDRLRARVTPDADEPTARALRCYPASIAEIEKSLR